MLDVTTVDRRLGSLSARRRFQTSLLTTFASVALLIAAIGVYGIVHYAVAARWRELGVRVALGASPRAVMGDVIRRGMTLPLVGLGIGLAIGAGMTRLISSVLFGIDRADVPTVASTVIVLTVVAFVACWLPARRAAGVDPMIALRSD